MKKLYEMPTVELTKFDVEDVITASSAMVDAGTFERMTNVDVVTEWKSEWNSAWDNFNV